MKLQLALLVCFSCASIAVARTDRPNIVLIMADDLGIEGLGCYGGSDYATPNLDRLAAGGVRFTHAYAQPLCTPTRVQLMTGKYNHRNWLYFGVLPKGERTIGHLFSGFGYRTCIAGKWQLTSYDPPDFPGSDLRRGTGTHPDEAGFDEYSLFHSEETEDKGSRYANPTYLRNGVLQQEVGQYGEDVTVDFLLDYMQRHRSEPMFLYYPMALPHWPMVPTPHSAVWSEPERRLETSTQYFKDMVEYMDFLVGRLVEGIDKLGLRDDTLVVFYSDNGTNTQITSGFRGQRIVGGKGEVTQNGIRVPLIANWPGVISAGVSHDLVDATDFLPTLAEVAGESAPPDWGVEGVSFAARLRGEEREPRKAAFFWFDPRPGWDKERFQRHIFALDHNYKLFSDGRFFDIGGEGFRELLLDSASLPPEAMAAKARLQAVIDEKMRPPFSSTAREEADAFGQAVE